MYCYSFDLKGESLFIIGRTIENLCDELLLQLKRTGHSELKNINVAETDFDSKLNLLYHKLNYFSPGMFSKAMGLKWDRNTVGHKIKSIKNLEKQAAANISIGIEIIFFLELKIQHIINKRKNL